jgi:hypothetical protein
VATAVAISLGEKLERWNCRARHSAQKESPWTARRKTPAPKPVVIAAPGRIEITDEIFAIRKRYKEEIGIRSFGLPVHDTRYT